MSSALISTQGLSDVACNPHVRILDASWYMPSEKRDVRAEYVAAHLPGAGFLDIDSVCDRTSPYPHMLPSQHDFEMAVGALGIGNGDDVVVYDTYGIFSAARVWWMFRVYGHDKVKVLDGGLLKWKAEGRPLESKAPLVKPAAFRARFRPVLLRDKNRVRANIASKRELLLDARSPGRFSGQEPEPRPGLRGGHIEGSRNVFFREVLHPPLNTLLSRAELKEVFAAKNIETAELLAVTCGSGVTACILALALFELGNEDVAVYDGAWAEWGSHTA